LDQNAPLSDPVLSWRALQLIKDATVLNGLVGDFHDLSCGGIRLGIGAALHDLFIGEGFRGKR
jgi:hypothetical protein